MSITEKQLIHELAKEYTFRNFDFNNGTPEELYESYKEANSKITTVVDEENSKIVQENLNSFLEMNM